MKIKLLTTGSQIGCIVCFFSMNKIKNHPVTRKLMNIDSGQPAMIKKDVRLCGSSNFSTAQKNTQTKNRIFSKKATLCKNKNPFINS
jgi:hypothetical protein